MFRFLVICGCLLAVGQAGVIGGGLLATGPAALAVQQAGLPLSAATVAVPTIATSSSNLIRGIGNLGSISASANSIDTPLSSVRGADVRVNNPGIVTATAVTAPVTAAVAGPALLAPGLTSAIAAGPAIAGLTTAPLGLNGLAATSLGLNGLALNGIGAVKVI